MPTFDVVSKTDLAEVDNALAGVGREVAQRFDFKGSHCSVERTGDALTILADDDLKMKQLHELLITYCTRRGVDARALDFKPEEKAAGNTIRQVVAIKQGIDKELAKTLIKGIKDSKLKVQASIQGDELRISGKKRDDLQDAIAQLKKLPVEQPLQYVNFRD